METLLAGISDALMTFDREWRFTFCNDKAAEITGYPPEKVLGRVCWEIFPSSVGTCFQDQLQRAMAEQKAVRFEHYHARLDSWLENRVYPTPGGVALFAADITERKRAEERMIEDDRRKDEFLAMLAHELRNPLAPIVNATEMLHLRGGDAETRTRAVEMISRQARHMARLLDDLLDFSRIRYGKIELRREPLEISELMRRVVDAFRTQAETRGQEIALASPGEPVWLDADPARLEQILANLLNNAIKFTPVGGRVALSAEAQGDEVLLRVEDNGAGIPPELGDRIFDPFVQEDHSLARSQGGLGIGLTLVRTLAGLHGGSVAAHSEGRGHGSELVVRLPRRPPPEAFVLAPAPPSGLEERRRKILLVEDNPDAAAALADLLTLWGYQVVVAADSEAALEAVEAFAPRILLLDIGLPGMDGYELARRLRERPPLSRARFIALTGYGQEADRDRSAAAGFDHHLMKPVDPPLLKELLSRRG